MKNSLENKIWEFPRDTEFTQICLLDDWTSPVDNWTTKLSSGQLDLSTGQLDNFKETLQLIKA
jgi:hypothetical protein